MDRSTFKGRIDELLKVKLNDKPLALWWKKDDGSKEVKIYPFIPGKYTELEFWERDHWEGRFIVYGMVRGHFGDYELTSLYEFDLKQLLGCCGVVVCGRFVMKSIKEPKINAIFTPLITLLAEGMGYTTLLITDVPENDVHERLMRAPKEFRRVYDFINSRTGNKVDMFVKKLSPIEFSEEEDDYYERDEEPRED